MNEATMIEIPGDKLREAIAAAYDLSKPQGLGFLHAKSGGLDDETIDAIIERDKDGHLAASMDYVHGRSCKFRVDRGDGGRLFIGPSWYDHGDWRLQELLTRLGVEEPEKKIADARAAQEAEYRARQMTGEGE